MEVSNTPSAGRATGDLRSFLRQRKLGTLGVLLILTVSFSCRHKSDLEKAEDSLNRGLTAHAEGRLDEATNAYHEVLSLDPQNKYAHYNLGLIEHVQGRPGPAEDRYRLALSYDPDFSPALYNLAILRTEPSPTEAVDLYRHIIEVEPGHARAHLNLGFLLISLGQNEEGEALIYQAILLDPRLEDRLHTQEVSEDTPPEPA